MARAPDARAEQAKELFLSGKKLIEISEALGVPEGTVRSWKNRYGWESNANATLQKPKRNVAKRKGGQRETRTLSGTEAAPHQRIIRMQLQRESLKLSFLIAWNRMNCNWLPQYQRTRNDSSCRRSSC